MLNSAEVSVTLNACISEGRFLFNRLKKAIGSNDSVKNNLSNSNFHEVDLIM